MDTIKIKGKIHKLADAIEDTKLLQQFYEALHDRSSEPEIDILDELTPNQKSRIKKSIIQAKRDQTIPNEKVKKEVKEWLKN